MSSFRACARLDLFQPTLPARGATNYYADLLATSVISTHAPRTGSDNSRFRFIVSYALFQPTLPARGATTRLVRFAEIVKISTHAPRTGSDQLRRPAAQAAGNFNPRSPHGERRGRHFSVAAAPHFNPRSPHGERRRWEKRRNDQYQNFNPRSPHGERRWISTTRLIWWSISTHAPRTGSDALFQVFCIPTEISTHAPRTGSDNGASVQARR